MQKETKTSILILGHYLPAHKVGGPVVSIINLVKNLINEFNFNVIAPDRDFGESTPYPNLEKKKWLKINGVLVYYIPINFFTSFTLVNQIRKKVDENTVVYLNSVFNFQFSIFVVLAKRLRLVKIENLILSPRGELFDEALGFKSSKKIFFIKIAKLINLYKNVIWHATTENEKNYIVNRLKINPNNIRVAMIMSNTDNGLNQSTLKTNEISENIESLRIIYLGRISKDKNIGFTFEVLKKIKIPVIFDIYGQIEEQLLWSECLVKIKELPLNIKVNYHGVINHDIVKKTLRGYDLFFLPTFAENFGHAIAESLSVGTPVLISDNTPWRNLEKEKLGWDINLNKIELFVDAINKVAKYSIEERRHLRKHIVNVTQARLNNPDILLANKNLFKLPFHNK